MQYFITDTSIIQITETSGTIQNISNSTVEISNSADFTDSFLLYPLNKISFNERLYLRAYEEVAQVIQINVARFIVSGSTTSTNTADEMLDSIFGGAVSDESVTSDADADSYFDDIFSGNSSSNVDDEDFNSYMDSIFGGNG